MIKTVVLTGDELMVKDLNGFNTVVHNLGEDTIYASKYPNVAAGADNVAEIPAGSAKLISTTNGTVYLLGSGKAELTGQDHEYVSSSSGSSSGTSNVTKAYVDKAVSDSADASKAYTDNALSSVNSDITSLQTDKADKSEIPTTLPANGGNADTVNNHTVKSNVPENAVFTDTTYTAATAAPKANGTASAGTSVEYARADHVHPIQTSVSGNAGSADKLKNARKINGVAFDGSADITITAKADGGNADTVNGHTVKSDVPENAKFTDTTYSNMTGATASAAGKAGLVPAPAAGSQAASFLKASGGWTSPLTPVQGTAAADLNNFTASGCYYFMSSNSPTNAPVAGAYGWLFNSTLSSSRTKQIWLNAGSESMYVRTKGDKGWSVWRKLLANDVHAVVAVVQGSISELTVSYGTYYVPYAAGARSAVVEVWKTTGTGYGSRYMSGLSSSMTAISGTTIVYTSDFSAIVGAASNGSIAIGGGVGSGLYRVTWLT